MKKNIKRKIFTLFVIFQILVISGMPSFADASFGVTDLFGAVSQLIEELLNINSTETLKPITETLNVFNEKAEIPSVGLTFDKLNPKPGDVVTVTANVSGLKNPNTALYTFLIKYKDDDPKDVKKMKVNALKENIKHHSSFKPISFDDPIHNKGANGNGKVEFFEYELAVKAKFGVVLDDGDRDGYNPKPGGDFLGAGMYYAMIGNGVFEMGEASGSVEPGECDDDYYPVCMVESNERDCSIDGSVETSSSSKSGGAPESSSGTKAVLPGDLRFSRCVYNGAPDCTTETICPNGGTPYCAIKPSVDISFVKQNDACPPSEAVMANKIAGLVVGNLCQDFSGDNSYFLKEYKCEETPGDEDDFQLFGGHLFPFAEEIKEGLGLQLEFLLGLDPTDPDTIDLRDGNIGAMTDAQFIAGLGVKELKFTYQEGMQIGAVAEGVSNIPTKHEDSSFFNVFAFLSNGPGCGPRNEGAYNTLAKGKELLIKTTGMGVPELDFCLENNFVEIKAVEERSLSVSLDVNLGLEGAITSGQGLPLRISALANYDTTGETQDSSKLNYRWSLKCSADESMVCEDGIDISKEMSDGGFLGKVVGNNIPLLSLTANFPDKCFDSGGRGWLCVSATINSSFKENKSSFGMNNIPIPIQKSGGEIKTYSITTDGDTLSTKEEICSDERNFSLCRLVRGEIIKVEMPIPEGGSDGLVSWNINEKDYDYCNSKKSSECFFPVIAQVGEHLTVSATYSDPSEGEFSTKTVSRDFVVVEPSVKIKVASGGNFRENGKRINEEGKKFADISKKYIEVDPESSISLEADIEPNFAEANTIFNWSFNDEESFDKSIQFVPNNLPDGVSLEAIYETPRENIAALKKLFGISQDNFSKVYMNDNVNLVEKTDVQEISKNKTKGFFATTANNTPAYFFFVLKTFLIISAMLFISHLIFSLVNYGNSENRRY